MRYVVVLRCIVVLVLLVDSAVAQSHERWVGRRIMVREGTAFQVGGEIVARETRNARTREGKRLPAPFYRVERVNGPWLWVVAEEGGIQGWIPATNAVTLEYAIESYNLQIRLNPTAKANYQSRGDMWTAQESFRAAMADYNKLIQLDPADADSYLSRGALWQRMGEPDKAIADFSQAVRLDPGNATAFTKRGNVRYAMEEDELALADYNEAIRLDPNEPWARLGRGNVRFFRKAFFPAIADYNIAIGRLPYLASAYAYRGDAWDRVQHYDKALADYATAIRLDPKCENAYLSRASLRSSCPDPKYRNGALAIASATRACDLSGWTQAKALAVLAAAYAASGDYDQAVVWQTKAAQRSMDEVSKRERLGRLESYKARAKPAPERAAK